MFLFLCKQTLGSDLTALRNYHLKEKGLHASSLIYETDLSQDRMTEVYSLADNLHMQPKPLICSKAANKDGALWKGN